MVELDALDVKILTLLQENGRQSFQEVARRTLTTVPTVKSRIDRLMDIGVIEGFTVKINSEKLGVSSGLLIVGARPSSVDRIASQLAGLEEAVEVYTTPDSETAIVCKLQGNEKSITSIQDKIDLEDVTSIKVLHIKSQFKKEAGVPLDSQAVRIACAYCNKEAREGAVKKKIGGRDYYFCCNTCKDAFQEKYDRISRNL